MRNKRSPKWADHRPVQQRLQVLYIMHWLDALEAMVAANNIGGVGQLAVARALQFPAKFEDSSQLRVSNMVACIAARQNIEIILFLCVNADYPTRRINWSSYTVAS